MIARIRRWFASHRFVEVDDVVIVPLDKWHEIVGERDRLRVEVERLRSLVRCGV